MFYPRLKKSAAALGVFIAGAAWADYTLIDLGPIGPDNLVTAGVHPSGINSSGDVVGSSGHPDYHAVMYSGGTLIDLHSYFGTGGTSSAADINDSGYVIGGYSSPSGQNYAFWYEPGVGMHYLSPIGGSVIGALSINANGDIGGLSSTSTLNNLYHGFIYSNGVMTDIGTLPSGTQSIVRAINNNGNAVGDADAGGSTWRAIAYSNGVLQDLGTLGGTSSTAFSINDNGLIVGVSSLTGDLHGHAFFHDGTTMTDLGTLGGDDSFANDINNSGDIVGTSKVHPNNIYDISHAFLYSNGSMQDLNNLLPAGSTGWILVTGQSINDYGQIVGSGVKNGESHGYMLSPGC